MPTGDVEVPAHARRLEPQISLPPLELLKHDLAERGSERVPPLLDLAAERPARSSVMQWMIMSPRAASRRLALTLQ
jgi:hypothetical protein